LNLPSFKGVNCDELDSVEKQLAKTVNKKILLQDEMDRIEGQKNSMAAIKRKKEIESEMKDCTQNIVKFKKYLK
jgi:hypothetical protein